MRSIFAQRKLDRYLRLFGRERLSQTDYDEMSELWDDVQHDLPLDYSPEAHPDFWELEAA